MHMDEHLLKEIYNKKTLCHCIIKFLTNLMQSHILVMEWSNGNIIFYNGRQVNINGARHLRISCSPL